MRRHFIIPLMAHVKVDQRLLYPAQMNLSHHLVENALTPLDVRQRDISATGQTLTLGQEACPGYQHQAGGLVRRSRCQGVIELRRRAEACGSAGIDDLGEGTGHGVRLSSAYESSS